MSNNCILCKLKNEEIEVTKIFEDDLITVVMDIQPVNPGHLLIFPHKCVQLITELEEETLGHMMKVAKKMNLALRNSGLKCEGVNLFLADGEAANQEIPHCHLHVFPRYKNDGFGFNERIGIMYNTICGFQSIFPLFNSYPSGSIAQKIVCKKSLKKF